MPQPLNPIRPGTQAELTRQLADTIGEEVVQAMEGASWEHTQSPPVAPVAPAQPANPAAVPSTTEQTPQAASEANPTPAPTSDVLPNAPATDFEQYKDPTTGKYLGKYNSPDEMLKGMHSLIHWGREAHARADGLNREVADLRQKLSSPVVMPVPVQQGQPSVFQTVDVPTVKLDAVLSRVKESGEFTPEDLGTLKEGILEAADQIATRKVNASKSADKREQQVWQDVDAHMSKNYPDSLKFADEMQLFVDSNPEVARVFNRLSSGDTAQDKIDGVAYVWKEFQRTIGAVNPATVTEERKLLAAGQVRQEEVEAARVQAGLAPSAAGGVHEASPSTGASQEQVQEAVRYMNVSGDGRLWRELTIGKDLKGPFFD